MANVKFQAPNPYSQQAADLNRRQKMAELLQQQAMEPLQQQSAGGMVIPLNPLAGLAKVLQSYTSSRQLSDLDKKRAGLEAQDIKSAQEMAAQFRTRSVDQPIAEGDNTLRELAVRPIASKVAGEEYRTEMVEPAIPLAERQQNLLPAALGAGVGPHQQKLAQMLYEEKPEAPKGAIAPINMKDVDVSNSNMKKYLETGDPSHLTMRKEPEPRVTTTEVVVDGKRIIIDANTGRKIGDAYVAPPAKNDKLVQVDVGGKPVLMLESEARLMTPYIKPTAELKPSEYESKSGSFANRMGHSNSLFEELSPTTLKETLASKTPVIGNFLLTENAQAFNQAAIDFITAQLRKESGATITDSEISTGYKNYIPLPGDGERVKKQKAFNRKLAVENMKREAGPTYKPLVAESDVGNAVTAPDGKTYVFPTPEAAAAFKASIQ